MALLQSQMTIRPGFGPLSPLQTPMAPSGPTGGPQSAGDLQITTYTPGVGTGITDPNAPPAAAPARGGRTLPLMLLAGGGLLLVLGLAHQD